ARAARPGLRYLPGRVARNGPPPHGAHQPVSELPPLGRAQNRPLARPPAARPRQRRPAAPSHCLRRPGASVCRNRDPRGRRAVPGHRPLPRVDDGRGHPRIAPPPGARAFGFYHARHAAGPLFGHER
nr:hypothetical protein [Tanacetum cinerariifolium]